MPTGADLESQARGLLASPGVVQLGQDRHGETLYTTAGHLAADAQLLRYAKALRSAEMPSIDGRAVGHAIAKGKTAYGESHAVRFALQDTGGLAILRSHDFAAKKRVMAALDHAYRASGARVMGLAKDDQAARYMRVGRDACDTRSLASWQKAWGTGQDRMQAGDVLIVDQAQKLSRPEMAYVLERASQAGGRVVLLDDTRYLMSSRSAATELGEQLGHHRLDGGARQRGAIDSDRASVCSLGTQQHGQAEKALLQKMRERGAVTARPSRKLAREALSASWAQDEMRYRGSSIALTPSRSEADALNQQIRDVAKSYGWLGQEATLACRKGPKTFAVGDRVIFTENSASLDIRKGSLGEIVALDKSHVTVRLDREAPVVCTARENRATDSSERSLLRTFEADSFRGFDHGYATTVVGAQNVHVERSYLLATPGLNRELTHVALSRHTQQTQCFHSRIDFRTPEALEDRISRPAFEPVSELRSAFVHQEQVRAQEQARAQAERSQEQAKEIATARSQSQEREEGQRVRDGV